MGGFWAGPENRLVAAGIETILERRGQGFGPVLFFGPCASGKTHLALGSVSAYRTSHRQRSAAYVTAVDFSRELADAIDTQTVDEFRQRYRRPSLLAIDDVDRLSGKDASQRELAATLDAVLEAGGQMLLTSSVAPGQLTGFLPQLQSRLIGGLTIPVALPGLEARAGIVRRLAELRGLELGPREAETLARELKWSVPRLSGRWPHWRPHAAPVTAIRQPPATGPQGSASNSSKPISLSSGTPRSPRSAISPPRSRGIFRFAWRTFAVPAAGGRSSWPGTWRCTWPGRSAARA